MSSTTCRECGIPFTPARADARFCSSACRQRAYRNRKQPNQFRNTTRVTNVDEAELRRQIRREVEAEYQAKLDAERKTHQTAVAALKADGLITRSQWKKLIACLHSDTHGDQCHLTARKLDEAFTILTGDPRIELLLVKDEKVKLPTDLPPMDEMLRRREATRARNQARAKKAAQTRAAKS